MRKERKSRAFNARYESPSQGVFPGFEHPFTRELDPTNRWVVLSELIPWDELCSVYMQQAGRSTVGRAGLSPRIILGALIIKYLLKLDDRETVDQISENIYMQYFLGYPDFTSDKPFDASLFVDIRKRLGMESINAINEKIIQLKTGFATRSPQKEDQSTRSNKGTDDVSDDALGGGVSDTSGLEVSEHKGRILFDATVCPQDIAYPTDLDLLSEAREITERLTDSLYDVRLHGEKPRTYRRIARKEYLVTAQKKKKTKKQIRSAVRKQLGYVGRNLRSIHHLLDACPSLPFDRHQLKDFWVIQTLYEQQLTMYRTRTHTIEDRIVSIHQPHVRPIVRGKASAPVEFGAKIHLSVIDGISFLDELSWDAFNEGSHMEDYVEKYRQRFGFYPREVLADKLYCTRENRRMLKSKGSGIVLRAKPLGRPSATAVSIHVSPGERNAIEGKFGQAKRGYGLNRIKARLQQTSESWIAGIIMVLNLVKLAGAIAPCCIVNVWHHFSARIQIMFLSVVINLRENIHRLSCPMMAVSKC